MSFEKSIAFTRKMEGGLAEHVSDPGGITNHGISFTFLQNLSKSHSGRQVLEKIGIQEPVQPEHIRNLSSDQADYIYKKEFWEKLQADTLPFPLDLVLFDAGVNCGIAQSVKLAQKAYNALNSVYGSPLAEDGILGIQTRTALSPLNNPKFIEECIFQREEYYNRLVLQKPTLAVFLKGWQNRCIQLRKYIKTTLKKMEKEKK